jgi:AhpC/TSA antioxidant enzyme
VQLHRARDEIEGSGARLAVIGQGTPAHAADFRRSQHVDLPLLVDTDRRAYAIAGTRKATFGELLGPKVLARGLRRSLASRVHQGSFAGGDPAQLGGVLIVAPDGSIPWAHLSQDASDNPPVAEVIAAAQAVGAPA